MNDLTIINKEGILVVDSREVAEMIGKRHTDLLRDIDTYIQYLENAKLRSQEFFIESEYKTEGNNKTYKCYLLTKKGCDMVANKMTGEKGVIFTAKYVTKFEEMEKQLQQPLQIDSKFLYQIAAQLEEKERQIALMKPKADYFDDLVDRNLLTSFRDTAKELKIQESKFIEWLLKNGYIYRDRKKKLYPYAQYVGKLFELKEWKNDVKAGNQTLITPRGRETFRLLLVKDGLIKEAI